MSTLIMPKVAAMDKIYHYEVTNFHEKVAAMDKEIPSDCQDRHNVVPAQHGAQCGIVDVVTQ